MRQESRAPWPEIDCQIDEILLQVSSGVPEEQIMRSIGVELRDWMSYKMTNLDSMAALFPNLTTPSDRACDQRRRKHARRRGAAGLAP